MDKQESMAKLREEAAALLGEVCDPGVRLVWGEGNLDTPLVLVGEAPGGTEDRLGHPFVGQAGKFLSTELESAGIRREDVYITNVVKCRPISLTEGRPSNRTPTLKEVAAWMDLLMRELSIIEPAVILCLGAVAASAIIHPGFKMTAERGKWLDGPLSSRAMATFHPSYVLRTLSYGGSDAAEQFRSDLSQAIDAAWAKRPV